MVISHWFIMTILDKLMFTLYIHNEELFETIVQKCMDRLGSRFKSYLLNSIIIFTYYILRVTSQKQFLFTSMNKSETRLHLRSCIFTFSRIHYVWTKYYDLKEI